MSRSRFRAFQEFSKKKLFLFLPNFTDGSVYMRVAPRIVVMVTEQHSDNFKQNLFIFQTLIHPFITGDDVLNDPYD